MRVQSTGIPVYDPSIYNLKFNLLGMNLKTLAFYYNIREIVNLCTIEDFPDVYTNMVFFKYIFSFKFFIKKAHINAFCLNTTNLKLGGFADKDFFFAASIQVYNVQIKLQTIPAKVMQK